MHLRSILQAVIEEARRRARQRRRKRWAASVVVLALGAVVFVSTRDRTAPQRANPIAVLDRLTLQQQPYLGVSCHISNDISCDRVGLAVRLRRPVVRLSATVNGRPVELRKPCGLADGSSESCASYCEHVASDQPCGTYFEGFLHPAGLLTGPGRLRTDDGGRRWTGTDPTSRVVRIVGLYRDGQSAALKIRVPLHAGWG